MLGVHVRAEACTLSKESCVYAETNTHRIERTMFIKFLKIYFQLKPTFDMYDLGKSLSLCFCSPLPDFLISSLYFHIYCAFDSVPCHPFFAEYFFSCFLLLLPCFPSC